MISCPRPLSWSSRWVAPRRLVTYTGAGSRCTADQGAGEPRWQDTRGSAGGHIGFEQLPAGWQLAPPCPRASLGVPAQRIPRLARTSRTPRAFLGCCCRRWSARAPWTSCAPSSLRRTGTFSSRWVVLRRGPARWRLCAPRASGRPEPAGPFRLRAFLLGTSCSSFLNISAWSKPTAPDLG